LVRRELAECCATGAESWAPYYNALLSELLHKVKSSDEALNVLHEAQMAARKAADQFFWEAEMIGREENWSYQI
jgi:predicted ATPase